MHLMKPLASRLAFDKANSLKPALDEATSLKPYTKNPTLPISFSHSLSKFWSK